MEPAVDKEKLTPETIRRCLREVAVVSFVEMIIPAIGFGLSLWLTILFAGHVLFPLWIVLTVGFGIYTAVLLANGVAAIAMMYQPPVVVVSTRVKPVGEREMYMHGDDDIGHILYFHGYGKRHVPHGMYIGFDSWLSDYNVWQTSFDGDEFYLLLDPFNRIVYFFPCSNFEYMGELAPSKYKK